MTDNTTYVAQFQQSINAYTVTWVRSLAGSYHTMEIDTNVPFGTIPSYDGSEIISFYSGGQYSYELLGWSTDLQTIENPFKPVTKNITYYTLYKSTENFFEVTWINFDGSLLEVDSNVKYNSYATYNGTVPKKSTTQENYYLFKGWLGEDGKIYDSYTYIGVKTNLTFTALFDSFVVNNINEKTKSSLVYSESFYNNRSSPYSLKNETSQGVYVPTDSTGLIRINYWADVYGGSATIKAGAYARIRIIDVTNSPAWITTLSESISTTSTQNRKTLSKDIYIQLIPGNIYRIDTYTSLTISSNTILLANSRASLTIVSVE